VGSNPYFKQNPLPHPTCLCGQTTRRQVQRPSRKSAKVKELERQIDQLIYKLYGLTEEEIKIVEGEK